MKDRRKFTDLEVALNRQVELVRHVTDLHSIIYGCNTHRNNVNMKKEVLLHSLETLSLAIEVLLDDVKSLERDIRKGTLNIEVEMPKEEE